MKPVRERNPVIVGAVALVAHRGDPARLPARPRSLPIIGGGREVLRRVHRGRRPEEGRRRPARRACASARSPTWSCNGDKVRVVFRVKYDRDRLGNADRCVDPDQVPARHDVRQPRARRVGHAREGRGHPGLANEGAVRHRPGLLGPDRDDAADRPGPAGAGARDGQRRRREDARGVPQAVTGVTALSNSLAARDQRDRDAAQERRRHLRGPGRPQHRVRQALRGRLGPVRRAHRAARGDPRRARQRRRACPRRSRRSSPTPATTSSPRSTRLAGVVAVLRKNEDNIDAGNRPAAGLLLAGREQRRQRAVARRVHLQPAEHPRTRRTWTD